MKKRLSSLTMTLTLLQMVTVLLALVGVLMAILLLRVGFRALDAGYQAIGLPLGSYVSLLIVGFLTVGICSFACGIALWTFFRLCGRLKKGTAFTHANEQAMERIARCSLIVGMTLNIGCLVLRLAEALWGCVTGLYWLEMVVMGCLFLAVALIARALALLVRRVIVLQEEVDLTV